MSDHQPPDPHPGPGHPGPPPQPGPHDHSGPPSRPGPARKTGPGAGPGGGPVPASDAPLAVWQGPTTYSRRAAAAGHTLRVSSEDLRAAAAALSGRAQASAAAPGLRVAANAAGHPNADAALTQLADRFRASLTALDADREAAVANLHGSALTYEAVEARIHEQVMAIFDNPPPGGRPLVIQAPVEPAGPAVPAPRAATPPQATQTPAAPQRGGSGGPARDGHGGGDR